MQRGEEFVLIGIHYMLKVLQIMMGANKVLVMSLKICQHDRDNNLLYGTNLHNFQD
jgi:hypothetical protein